MSARKIAALVWFLALTPGLVVLVFMGPADFDNAGAVLNTAGRLTGILGLSMLLVAAALCCRVPGFDRPFGGLTKLWQLHHRVGAAAFLLLLGHPVFLSLAAADVSLGASVATLFSNTPGLWLGWLALLSTMVFLAPSFAFFGPPPPRDLELDIVGGVFDYSAGSFGVSLVVFPYLGPAQVSH